MEFLGRAFFLSPWIVSLDVIIKSISWRTALVLLLWCFGSLLLLLHSSPFFYLFRLLTHFFSYNCIIIFTVCLYLEMFLLTCIMNNDTVPCHGLKEMVVLSVRTDLILYLESFSSLGECGIRSLFIKSQWMYTYAHPSTYKQIYIYRHKHMSTLIHQVHANTPNAKYIYARAVIFQTWADAVMPKWIFFASIFIFFFDVVASKTAFSAITACRSSFSRADIKDFPLSKCFFFDFLIPKVIDKYIDVFIAGKIKVNPHWLSSVFFQLFPCNECFIIPVFCCPKFR